MCLLLLWVNSCVWRLFDDGISKQAALTVKTAWTIRFQPIIYHCYTSRSPWQLCFLCCHRSYYQQQHRPSTNKQFQTEKSKTNKKVKFWRKKTSAFTFDQKKRKRQTNNKKYPVIWSSAEFLRTASKSCYRNLSINGFNISPNKRNKTFRI